MIRKAGRSYSWHGWSWLGGALAALVLTLGWIGAPTARAGPGDPGTEAAATSAQPYGDDNALPHGADGPPDASPSEAPQPEPVTSRVVPAPAISAGQVQDLSRLEKSKSALADLERSITVSADRAAELKREIEAMKGDRAKQSAALIAASRRAKLAEIELGSMEERLSRLITTEIRVRSRLDGADGTISNLLAALQRISRDPPPALIVDPSDALASARGAMLMAAILPQLRQQAARITADLDKLGKLKAEAQSQQQELEANFKVLEEEQLRIATLIAARKQGESQASTELADAQRQADALKAKADSLKDVIAALTRRAQAVDQAAAAARLAARGLKPPSLDPDTIRIALANARRVAPAIPFSDARGWLSLPASGLDIVDFGASDGFGGVAQGMSMVTKPDAPVVAPADGWVVYKGPYLNYGQIVVLNPGEDYTILLAGLGSISVELGQFVQMGQPVGTMGSRTIGRTIATSAGVDQPTLYIELRKNNDPIDPAGWWASSNATENG